MNETEQVHYNLDEAIKVLEQKLDPAWIKQRQGPGGKKLDYIEGARVIDILNQAFKYQWSFEILSDEVVEVRDNNGNVSGRYIKVLGQIYVPGLGTKMAYGTKTARGSLTDQESVYKAAMTDCLKKCATMFGIGKELYLDDSDDNAKHASSEHSSPSQNIPQRRQFDPQDVARIKDYKAALNVTNNSQLEKYIQDWSGGQLKSASDITPDNIKMFNAYLKAKIDEGTA